MRMYVSIALKFSGRSTNIFKKKSDALAGIYDSISPNSNSKNASTLSPIESRSVARLETCSGTKFNDQSSLLFKWYQRDLSEKLFVKKIQNVIY